MRRCRRSLSECRLLSALMPVARCVAPARLISTWLTTSLLSQHTTKQRRLTTYALLRVRDLGLVGLHVGLQRHDGRCRGCEWVRSVKGGDGLSRNGSTWRWWPIRMRSKMAGRRREGCSAYGAGGTRGSDGGRVLLARVRTDGRSCIRILKAAGRETTVARSGAARARERVCVLRRGRD